MGQLYTKGNMVTASFVIFYQMFLVIYFSKKHTLLALGSNTNLRMPSAGYFEGFEVVAVIF